MRNITRVSPPVNSLCILKILSDLIPRAHSLAPPPHTHLHTCSHKRPHAAYTRGRARAQGVKWPVRHLGAAARGWKQAGEARGGRGGQGRTGRRSGRATPLLFYRCSATAVGSTGSRTRQTGRSRRNYFKFIQHITSPWLARARALHWAVARHTPRGNPVSPLLLLLPPLLLPFPHLYIPITPLQLFHHPITLSTTSSHLLRSFSTPPLLLRPCRPLSPPISPT